MEIQSTEVSLKLLEKGEGGGNKKIKATELFVYLHDNENFFPSNLQSH